MVAFLTLFLNLVSCLQHVELAVDGTVARVEIHLDGKTVGIIEGPPWEIDIDLGEELRPHLLEAVAFDADGKDRDRASQRVNVPHPPARVDLVLERDQNGKPVATRVAADSATADEIKRVSVRLDGLPLVADGTGRFVLPGYDPNETHILSAEVVFAELLSASAQLSFGGLYGSEVRTDLMAVPVVVDEGNATVKARLRGAMEADARRLKVAAVEELGVRIIMIQDFGATERLRRLARMVGGDVAQGFPRQLLVDAAFSNPNADLLQFFIPRPQVREASGRRTRVFPSSGLLTLDRRPLGWLVTRARHDVPPRAPESVADAVAAAGLAAAGTSCPRAVLLVVGDPTEDASLYTPGEVRSFLREIRVPLYVWSVTGGPETGPWGVHVDASSASKIHAAADALLSEVALQRIVWVEGRPLPNEVSFNRAIEGVRLLQ